MIGRAALGIWMTIDAAKADDFNAWYPRQHLPERLSVPGFLRGRRYVAVDATLPYFTLYELASPDVTTSAAYLERLNAPTDWTRRVLPTITTFVRNAYRLLAATPGDPTAGHLLTVRIKPDSGRGPYVREWLERDAVAEVGAAAGVTGVGAYVSESAGTSVETEEKRIMRGEVLAAPPLLALCEVGDVERAAALRAFWSAWARRIAAGVTLDFYRLMYGLAWLGDAERR
jgi:hypothetical protein